MAATADLIHQKLKQRYPAAVVTWTLSENFNKADGPLGPNLSWTRVIFKTLDLVGSVVSNVARWFSNVPSDGVPLGTEDIILPSPNMNVSDVTVSVQIIEASRTGVQPYLVDGGVQARFRETGIDDTYTAYAVAFGRNNIIFPGIEGWHLWLFRLVNNGEPDAIDAQRLLIGFQQTDIANITLPATLTYTIAGDHHVVNLTHGGPGPTLTIDVTDAGIGAHGAVNMGVGPVVPESGSITFRADNWQASASIPQTAAELLKRYRADNGLNTWESYVAHVAGASPSGHFADDENAFWNAFVP